MEELLNCVLDKDDFLFSKDKFFLGSSLSIGDLDSERRYTQGERNSLGQIVEPSSDEFIENLGLTAEQEVIMNDVGAFVVERYVRTGKTERAIVKPKTVFTLQKLRQKFSNTLLKNNKLSEIFSTPCEFGIRISYVFPDLQKNVFSELDAQLINKNKTYYVEGRSILPLASFTYDFVDETIEEFV